jgi:hypothetical protein
LWLQHFESGEDMTDKELLQLAAKAAGFIETASVQNGYGFIALLVMDEDGDWTGQDWNPLTDDGDALRLAVKSRMIVEIDHYSAIVNGMTESVTMGHSIAAATRRAIVRAAADVGKGMLTHDEFVAMFPGRFEEKI